MRICALVPTYDNPRTVRAVVERIRAHGLDVLVVDDGSGPEGRAACEQLARDGLATVLHRPRNTGKGAACMFGFAAARERGYTHAFQIDADGQHDLDRIPAFVAAAEAEPEAVVMARPVYDDTAPLVRRLARRLTAFWVAVEVGRGRIADALIGFRVYPLAAVARLGSIGSRMEFDVEIAVQLVRGGSKPVNLPVAVRYLPPEEGGVSHWRPVRDNLRLAWMHSRICTLACVRWTFRRRWRSGARREVAS